ncbi:5-oxoprolinase subunit PxpB [Hymenobacter wooponensis]|uniref:5-oxoprolinase subunit PxpB n=1 Tax=Hymenobacter wooponensis TaxID=1525360 RepID=A0A4Z0MCL6_9BACT|nr:5-oxoprolinase subunit PxpB [Hymenobacter wooponensis]TGD77120.1 5-oxoprolinase subunit PxpB [Hymenobacter wooponensis]
MEQPSPPHDLLSTAQLYPLGDAAVVLQLGDTISEVTHRAIQVLGHSLDQVPFPGLREYVSAFTTLTVYYDPWVVSRNGKRNPYKVVADRLYSLLCELPAASASETQPLVEIPVCYGGSFGPDLALVAEHTGLAPAEVIRLHTEPEYLVYMIGFAPGFPYLGGMPEQLTTPRKAQPRPLVPAGSVGIAGGQTGVYSLPTPGGWQLIGRTPRRLFTPEAASPSLLRAGQRLRFVAISEEQYEHLLEHEL